MAGRRSEVRVNIVGEADLGSAAKEVERDFAKMERASKDTARKIERAFDDIDISPEIDPGALRTVERDFDAFVGRLSADGVDLQVDTDELRRAFDLADQLDKITADITVETDVSELQQAEALARSLKSFTGRVGLDVQGTNDLRAALGLAENLDQIRQVKIDVAGRQDLERAEAIARGLDGSRVDVKVDVNDTELDGLAGQFGEAGQSAGDAFGDGFDPEQIGTSLSGGMLGVVGNLGPWGVAAAGIGALFADDFSAGFEASWGGARETAIRAIRTGLSDADIEEVGEAAAEAYAVGFGESIVSVRDTAALIKAELGSIDDSLDLTEATKQAEALAEVFGIEVADSVRLAQRLVANDLADSTEEAFNLMAAGAQDFGVQTEDALAGFDEFAPVFKKLGIDGARAFEIVGEQIDQGLVTSVDRAFEQFEEFNIAMTDGSAREAVEELGLSFDDLAASVAAGRGGEAMAEIAEALAGVGDEATRNRLFVDIFGSSVESAGAEANVLALLATADAVGEIGSEASDATARLEETRTNLDKVKKFAEDLGSAIADGINAISDQGGLLAGASGGFDSLAESMFGAESASASLSDRVAELTGGVLGRDLNPKLLTTSDGLAKVGEEAEEAAGGLDTTTEATERLDAALSEFASRFDSDQVFRSIEEDAISAAEAVAELTGDAYDLGTGFDITTEAGRAAEAAFEDLSGNLDSLIKGYQDGTISGDELAAGQDRIRAALLDMAGQVTDTDAEAQELLETYGLWPEELNTTASLTDNATESIRQLERNIDGVPDKTVTLNADRSPATASIRQLERDLAGIKDRTVTVTTKLLTIGTNPIPKRHGGGDVEAGQPYIVGGPGAEELFVPKVSGHVFDPQETRRMVRAAAERDFSSTPFAAGGGGGRGGVYVENWYVERGREPAQDIHLLEQMFSL